MRRIIIAAGLVVAGCQQSPSAVEVSSSENADTTTADVTDPVADCARRGVAYFKEIGSYPTLSSPPNRGKSAEEVAAERCARTTTAFP